MVGIIVATHGELANGLLHASNMIFGEQENFAVCSLTPEKSPESFKEQILQAVSSFENKDEVLVLVDLWSGTPFNQVNALLDEHPNWGLVAGANLPMLFEAFEAREDVNTAHEVASRAIEAGRKAIKGKPESLNPKCHSKKVMAGAQLAEQDGEIEYVLARIDTRLLHGQVATSWAKTTKPNRIIVVSDAVSKDNLRKKLIEEATPPGIKAHVVPLQKMLEVDKDRRFGGTKAMLLFETPQEALKAIEGGLRIKSLNLGSMAHTKDKKMITRALSMDLKDVETFEKILSLGIEVEVRKVPADTPENINEILDRVKKSFLN